MESKGSKEIIDEIMCKYNEIVLVDAFRFLKILFKNVLKNEDNDQFKIIRLTNPVLKSKLFIVPEVFNLIETTGYVKEGEEMYVFKGEREKLEETKQYLKGRLKVLKAAKKRYEEEKKKRDEEMEKLKKENQELRKRNAELLTKLDKMEKMGIGKETEKTYEEDRYQSPEREREHAPSGYHWSPAPSCYEREFGAGMVLVEDYPRRYSNYSSGSSAEERCRRAMET